MEVSFEKPGRFLYLLAAFSEGSLEGGESPGSFILVVGDGMGVAHRDAVRLATVGLEGSLAMG